jgi:hypothetical protein
LAVTHDAGTPEIVATAACPISIPDDALVQTAMALVPSLERPTCGSLAFPPVAERSVTVTVPQVAGVPEMVVEAVWMMSEFGFEPLRLVQTAVALVPSLDRATCGSLAF